MQLKFGVNVVVLFLVLCKKKMFVVEESIKKLLRRQNITVSVLLLIDVLTLGVLKIPNSFGNIGKLVQLNQLIIELL